MKYKMFFIGLLIFSINLMFRPMAWAQWTRDNRVLVTDSGVVMGGMGFSFIEDQSFFTFNLRSELKFGEFAMGIDAPLRFNTDTGELRDQDWDEKYDYVRIIRYLKYGRKRGTPIYARLGTLDAAKLGHGFIMNYYTNEIQYDRRKIGLEFDADFDLWGWESVFSNFERLEIMGGRGYVRPLQNVRGVSILKNLTFGATLVTDQNTDVLDSTDEGVTIGGLDIELPLINFGPLSSMVYADYAKIKRFGSGQAIGLEIALRPLDAIFSVHTKIERRFLGKHFLPSYFNPFYENERLRVTDAGSIRKTDQLLSRSSKEQGIYAELFGELLKLVKFIGTFERIDGQKDSGRLHMAGLLSQSIARFTAHASYDRTGIQNFSDTFSLDDRSMARIGVGYQANPYMILFMNYIWTFQLNEVTQTLETQRRVEPQVAFVFPINFARP